MRISSPSIGEIPSTFIGPREEKRFGEDLGKMVYRVLGHGPLKRILGTEISLLTDSMVERGLSDAGEGARIIGPTEIGCQAPL